jgi:sugar phosphate isomerase/epimerase
VVVSAQDYYDCVTDSCLHADRIRGIASPALPPGDNVKLGICNEIFQGWEIEAAMRYVAGLGYNGIELAPFTLARTVTEISKIQRQRVRDTAARLGIEICGLHWLLAKTEGLHLNHPDSAVRNRTGKYLCELADCCADLGGKVLVLGSPQQRNIMPGVTPAQAWEFTTATIKDAVRRAEERGVILCLEPLSTAETNFINTASQAIRFAGQFNSPAMQIILDVKAMCAEAGPIPEIIRQSWPHFAHFHANDSNLKGPGFGKVDFRPIAAALNEVGYAGYMSVEVFQFEEGPEAIATRSLDYLRKIFSAASS